MITPTLCRVVLAGALMIATSLMAAENTPPVPLKDAEGRTLRRAPTGHITNYYEEKAGSYVLPDPLVMANGAAVRDADAWFSQRRPELFERYETEIYGRVPTRAPTVAFEVVEDVEVLHGIARRKRIVGRFGDKADGPAVNVMLYRPALATGPLPLVLHISFGGDPALPLPAGTPPRRFSDMGPAPEILSRGYAYAVVRYTEIQADTKDGYTGGVIGLALAPGQEKPAPDEWGTIAAWTWGLSRIMDYLETEPTVDAQRVALVGHSRLGKTALWSGASDPRYALIYASQSGEMGAALSRRDFGETVDDMAANYGYQFAGNLQKYPGRWNEMPHEGHLLISLSAPRPVFISAANGDMWSDPHGQFLAVVAAGPVWRLLGKPDLGTTERPALDVPVSGGTLAFLENKGPHIISPLDWRTFLDFADRHLKATSAARE